MIPYRRTKQPRFPKLLLSYLLFFSVSLNTKPPMKDNPAGRKDPVCNPGSPVPDL